MLHIYVYIISSVLFAASSLCHIKHRLLRLTLIFFGCIVFFIPLSIRAISVGIDTHAYYQIHSILADDLGNYTEYRYEPGFILLNNIVTYLGLDADFFIFLTAFISFFTVFFFIYKNSQKLLLSIALMCGIGFYGFMFNGVRQAIAMGIALIALHMLKNKKTSYFFIFLFFAICFHYTAVILLFAYIVSKFRTSFIIPAILWLFSLIFLLPSVSDLFFSSLTGFIPEVYSGYVFSEIEASSLRLRILTNQLFCLFFIFILWLNKSRSLSESDLLFLYLSFLGFLLGNILFHLSYLSRLALYFQVVSVVSVPFLIYKSFNRFSYYIVSTIIYIVMTAFYFRGLFMGANGMVPYITIWQ